jgi:hypothetical protein
MVKHNFEYLDKDTKSIRDNDVVKVVKTGSIIEITKSSRLGQAPCVKKLNKDFFVRLDTGELIEVNHSENRSENIKGIKETIKKVRRLINNNFLGNKNEVFLTLTYKDNMQDVKKLKNDFNAFWKRTVRFYKNKYEFEYLAVIEPQGRGAWHMHVLIKTHNINDSLWLENKDIADLWGHGFVKIERLDNVDNVGAYLSAYLTDLEVAENETFDKEVKGKKYKKGSRLHMYPAGVNIYRCSKGIKKPTEEQLKYKDIKKEIGATLYPDFKKCLDITDSNNNILNSVIYEQYNLHRHNTTN